MNLKQIKHAILTAQNDRQLDLAKGQLSRLCTANGWNLKVELDLILDEANNQKLMRDK